MGYGGAAQHLAFQATRSATFQPISNARAAAGFLRQDIHVLGSCLPGCSPPTLLKASFMPAGIPVARQDFEMSSARHQICTAIRKCGGNATLHHIKKVLIMSERDRGDSSVVQNFTLRQAEEAFVNVGLEKDLLAVSNFLKMVEKEGSLTARRISQALDLAFHPIGDSSLGSKPPFAWIEVSPQRHDPLRARSRRTVSGAYLQINGTAVGQEQLIADMGQSRVSRSAASNRTGLSGQISDHLAKADQVAEAAALSRGIKAMQLQGMCSTHHHHVFHISPHPIAAHISVFR